MAQEKAITDKRVEKERRKELRRQIKQDKAEARKLRNASRRNSFKENLGGVDLVVLVTVILFSLSSLKQRDSDWHKNAKITSLIHFFICNNCVF